MKLLQVQKFNQDANERYNKHVSEYEFGKGGFPFRPMNVFQTPEGIDRQRGWVATENDKHCFGMNKAEAILNFNK